MNGRGGLRSFLHILGISHARRLADRSSTSRPKVMQSRSGVWVGVLTARAGWPRISRSFCSPDRVLRGEGWLRPRLAAFPLISDIVPPRKSRSSALGLYSARIPGGHTDGYDIGWGRWRLCGLARGFRDCRPAGVALACWCGSCLKDPASGDAAGDPARLEPARRAADQAGAERR